VSAVPEPGESRVIVAGIGFMALLRKRRAKA